MIRLPRLYIGLLLASVGLQSLSAMLGDDSPWIGIVLLLFGFIVVVSSLPYSRRNLVGAAGVIIIQALISPGLIAILARWREVLGLADFLALITRSLGLPATASQGRVVVQVGDMVVDYLPSLSRLGAYPIILVLCGAFAIVVLLPVIRPGKMLVHLSLVLFGYAILRLLLILLARYDLPENGFETSIWVELLSFAPAAALLRADVSLAENQAENQSRLRFAATMLASVAWVLALGWVDPGQPKTGRVLFDDSHGHGDWEPTDTPFDTEHYSRRLSYAYRNFYDLLDWHYSARRITDGPITDADLETTDVLVVKTPTKPFSDDEVDAIEQFVKKGGGLLLIGDHTNLFGMTTYINRLAGRFSLVFRSDDTFAMRTEAQSQWKPTKWLPHPVAAQIPSFEFETSCTIDAPLSARAPMIGYGLGAEPADYSRPGFFGNIHLDLRDDYGFFVQYAAIDRGEGRVAAMSDSTPFSNFSIFFPGRRELLLATIEFLNRKSTPLRYAPLPCLMISVASVILLSTYGRGMAVGGVVLALIIGTLLGTAVARISQRSIKLPSPKARVPTILFDRSVSNLVLPSVLTVGDRWDNEAMDSLLVASQRLGYMPIVADELPEVGQADALILVHPNRVPSTRELQALVKYVAEGGNLLVLDGLLHPGTATNDILQPFGLSVYAEAARLTANAVRSNGNKQELGFSRPLLTVSGGEGVLEDSEKRPIYAEIKYALGRVGVLVDSLTFTKGALGSRFLGEPTNEQLAANRTAFFVLKRIVEGASWPPQQTPQGRRAH